MSQYATGPWAAQAVEAIDKCPHGKDSLIRQEGSGAQIGVVYGAHAWGDKTASANARLITAAPELLAALEQCLQFICHANFVLDPHWQPVHDKAYEMGMSAIARVEGGL